MRWLNILLAVLVWTVLPAAVLGAEHGAAEAAHGAGAGAEHSSEGLPADAPWVMRMGPLEINNSTVMMFAVAVLLIVGAQVATRNMKMVPEGAQNFAEWLVESL